MQLIEKAKKGLTLPVTLPPELLPTGVDWKHTHTLSLFNSFPSHKHTNTQTHTHTNIHSLSVSDSVLLSATLKINSLPLSHTGASSQKDGVTGPSSSVSSAAANTPSRTGMTLEDKMRKNFDEGRQELERRRRALQEKQEREEAEKERKRRQEEEQRRAQE